MKKKKVKRKKNQEIRPIPQVTPEIPEIPPEIVPIKEKDENEFFPPEKEPFSDPEQGEDENDPSK